MPRLILGNLSPVGSTSEVLTGDAARALLDDQDAFDALVAETGTTVEAGQDRVRIVRTVPLGHPSTTEVSIPDGRSVLDALKEIVDLWRPYHSEDPPEWVIGDGPGGALLAEAVAATFSVEGHVCSVVDEVPADWGVE